MEDWKLQPARDLDLPLSERPVALCRESGLLQTAGHLFWRTILRGYLTLYHRLHIRHADRLPTKPPFVMVSNHTSHLDAVALSAALPLSLCDRVFPIAAGDVFFRTPAVSWLSAGLINALPMWRKNCGAHALMALREKLLDGSCGYILFPEGTRSRNGELMPFRAGLGMLIAGTTVPLIPTYLHGAFAALPPDRTLPRPKRLTLIIGEPLSFSSIPDDRMGWAEVAATAEAAVRELGRGSP